MTSADRMSPLRRRHDVIRNVTSSESSAALAVVVRRLYSHLLAEFGRPGEAARRNMTSFEGTH